ncbi:MAG: hypothetical protein JWR16_1431 [Nevskia sp.]|nr:hypothetical protein [Nevskia sp.]
MRSLLALLRRFRISLAVITALLLIYALLGFLLVPHLARSAIQQQLAIDGRQLTIGKFRFNPFSLEANIEAFALNDDKAAPIVAFKSLKVNVGVFASIWRRGLVLQEVNLNGPYVSLVHEVDGSINLIKLVPPSKAPPQPQTAPSAPPRIRITTLVVDDGKVDIKDLARPQPFATRLSPIRFSLKDFRTELGHDNAYQFSGTALSGEHIDWSGGFTVQPLGSTGQFALKNLQAKTIDAYLQTQLPMRLVSGVGELNGSYKLSFDPALALDVALPALTVRDFAVAERGASSGEPPLAIAELGVQGVALSLAQRTVTVKNVDIKGAHVNAQRDKDGSLSLMRLLSAPNSKAKSPPPPVQVAAPAAAASPPATKEAAWRIGVDSIKLDAASIALDDRAVTPATHFVLNPINLSVGGYSSDTDAKLKIEADLKLEQGGQLGVNGDLQLQPLSSAMTVTLQGFELPLLQPYLTPLTGLTLKSGKFGGKGQLHYLAKPNAPMQLSFAGDVNIADFVGKDQAQQDFIKWRQLDVVGIDYQQTPQKLAIDRIALSVPYARVVIEQDRSLNVSHVINPKGDAAAAPMPAAPSPANPTSKGKPQPKAATVAVAAKPMAMRINTISIDKGSANFADRSIEPQFATAIVGLVGKITGLSTDPASRAKLRIAGSVDKYAPVLISGEINPLAATKYADVSLSFRNMDLTTFNPYSGRFAGYNIVKGKLTTELKYKIQDRKLDAQHHVIVDQLEFGEATGSKQAVPLPVRLAVSLLKDRHGVIDIELPVSGSLDDPTFSVAPIIWKVFVNLLTKVVTAPFAAIGRLFGGGDELSYVDFAAGSASLSESEAGKLGKLASALVERPQLRLDVPLAVAEAQDRKALAQAALDKLLPPAQLNATAKDRLKALERVHRDLLKKSPSYPDATSDNKDEVIKSRTEFVQAALIERLAPDAAALQALGKERAQAVQAAILGNSGVSAERIFVVAGSDSAATDSGAVRMALKLE